MAGTEDSPGLRTKSSLFACLTCGRGFSCVVTTLFSEVTVGNIAVISGEEVKEWVPWACSPRASGHLSPPHTDIHGEPHPAYLTETPHRLSGVCCPLGRVTSVQLCLEPSPCTAFLRARLPDSGLGTALEREAHGKPSMGINTQLTSFPSQITATRFPSLFPSHLVLPCWAHSRCSANPYSSRPVATLT